MSTHAAKSMISECVQNWLRLRPDGAAVLESTQRLQLHVTVSVPKDSSFGGFPGLAGSSSRPSHAKSDHTFTFTLTANPLFFGARRRQSSSTNSSPSAMNTNEDPQQECYLVNRLTLDGLAEAIATQMLNWSEIQPLLNQRVATHRPRGGAHPLRGPLAPSGARSDHTTDEIHHRLLEYIEDNLLLSCCSSPMMGEGGEGGGGAGSPDASDDAADAVSGWVPLHSDAALRMALETCTREQLFDAASMNGNNNSNRAVSTLQIRARLEQHIAADFASMRELGRGIFGVVYATLDLNTGRTVAAKRVRCVTTPPSVVTPASPAPALASGAAPTTTSAFSSPLLSTQFLTSAQMQPWQQAVASAPSTFSMEAAAAAAVSNPSPSSSQQHGKEKLMREIRLMRSLEHENIVRYLGVEMDSTRGGYAWLFMEYVSMNDFGTLSEMSIKKFHGRMPIRLVQLYTRQVLTALAYLHRHHIVHQDVKGANVLVGSSAAKLADFGTAQQLHLQQRQLKEQLEERGNQHRRKRTQHPRALSKRNKMMEGGDAGHDDDDIEDDEEEDHQEGEEEDNDDNEGRTTISVGPKRETQDGSPAFMAPEVLLANGEDRMTTSSDIWSLGCLVIEIATGQIPWRQQLLEDGGIDGILQLRNRMANGEKPKYPARPDFPPSGVAFLDSCLARDPMKRPTAAQLLQHSFMTDLASLQPSMQPSHSQANSLANTFSSGLQMSSAQQLQPAVISPLPHQTLEDLVEAFEATGAGGGVPSSGVCDPTVRSTPNKVKGKGALAVFSKPKPTPS